MRIPAATVAAAALSALAACHTQEPCAPQDHCLAAARIEGACQCTEWEVVRTQVVDLPYLVAAVVYSPAGNQSSLQYGGSFQYGSSTLVDLAPVGARWRAQVRDAEGEERVARAAAGASDPWGWRLAPVTASTVSLLAPAADVITSRTGVDVPDHAVDDLLAVWVNPRVTVETDWAGGRTVRWSGSEALPNCWGGPIRLAWVRPGQLLDGAPADDACAAAFLASLDQPQRAALAAYDAFYSPEGVTPKGLFDSARYLTAWNTLFSPGLQRTSIVRWACGAPPSDLDVQPLIRTEHAIPGGETLVIEYAALAAAGPCPDRAVALVEETTSEGCHIATALELDQVFGTLFHMMGTQWTESLAPACTR